MNKKLISIIIVCYNSLDLIEDCLDSIKKYKDIDDDELEVIIVDNSPTESALELQKYIEKYQSGFQIKYIKNENLGYGHGNNVGVKLATAEIVAIMNPDVRLSEPIFSQTIKHFEDENISSLGFQQITGNLNYSFFWKPEYFIPIITSLLNKITNKYKLFNEKLHYLSGAFIFFRKTDFIKIGMYDEAMFMYLEEPDVAKRINDLEKKTVFDKTKSYIHLMEQKENFNVRLLDIGTNSIKVYFKKHDFNLKKYIRLRILEHNIFNFIFFILNRKDKIETNNAYKKSLIKAIK